MWFPLLTLDELLQVVEHLHLGMYADRPPVVDRAAHAAFDPLRENETLRQSLYDLLYHLRFTRTSMADADRSRTRRLLTNYEVLLRLVVPEDNPSLYVSVPSLPYDI